MSFQSLSSSFVSVRESFSSQSRLSSFKDILSGEQAFYNQTNYKVDTRADLSKKELLPVSYTYNAEIKNTECKKTANKIVRVVKKILSSVNFPKWIYKRLHSVAAKFILPASNPKSGPEKDYADDMRSILKLDDKWKYKRITVEVEGCKIDAIIVGQDSTLNNGRWTLVSNGNGEIYEDKLLYKDNFSLLEEAKSNAIFFNYPGVEKSSGRPTRKTMEKAYRAMLNFLEDQEKGIGAKEIIGYGHSIGGGVQGDALKKHKFKKDIKYVFIKGRTFSDLSAAASALTIKILGFLVKLLGWNMDSVHSSKQLQVPEIILQTADVYEYEELSDSSKIIDDGVIGSEASLAKTLLDDDKCAKENKIFIGIPEMHNESLRNPSFLAEKIQVMLDKQNQ